MDGSHEVDGALSGEGDAAAVDYVGRALVKLDRAAELFGSLEQAVDLWNEDHELMAPTRSRFDGDPRVEFFRPAELDEEVPWDSWESTFHDGVHNLRVALDTFCFDLCRLEQAPPNPRDIHFPITDHANEWPNRRKALQAMPSSLLARVRQCQPWDRPDRQVPDPLKLISRIDNVDKHRATGVTFDVIPVMQYELRPTAPVPRELAESLEWPLTPWMTMTFAEPIEPGEAVLMPVMAVPIVTFEGLAANLPDAQRWLHREVWRVVSFIASGDWAEAGGFDRFLPEPTWWPLPGNIGQ